jgi:EAL domain-containing protein (putative c-di-GMP-specific phosphodiesterase class I)/GGDEF domain-containing protein
MRFVLDQLAWAVMQAGALLRRPEVLVFLPAVTLASFWLGGEEMLTVVALGLPMVFVMTGAIGIRDSAPMTEAEGAMGLTARPQLTDRIDRILRDAPQRCMTTACLVVQFYGAEHLLDRHGRAVQAEVLERSAERLVSALRQGDTVIRLEGGGLAVALGPVRRLDLEIMVQLSGRIQAAISPPLSIDGAQIYTSCSIGFCLASRASQQTGRALLDAAQVAADEALRHGPGAIRSFAPDMARTRADRDARRDEIEAALDDGQIRPHFQPQISTDTGEISGFEALARWQHPERGMIAPSDFLPSVEDSGLSERLSEVMLYNALAALVRWDKAGLSIPRVSVNLSAAELRNPKLPEKIKWELDRFDLDPERLTLEILETVVAETDNDVIVRNVAALAQLGCGIDLDDFGTGHASITNIRRFTLRRLKIDRSFVNRVDEDREQQKIVSAILSMAEQLGLGTLAEGVETPGEHAMLSQLGCGHVQGFGIGRPMPYEESADWILRHRARQAATPRISHRTG